MEENQRLNKAVWQIESYIDENGGNELSEYGFGPNTEWLRFWTVRMVLFHEDGSSCEFPERECSMYRTALMLSVTNKQ